MAEPTTTLTDYAIALECLLLAGLLFGQGGIQRLWAAAFTSVSGASALGGTYHGFAPQLSLEHRIWLWKGMGVAVAIASFFTLAAAGVPPGANGGVVLHLPQCCGYGAGLSQSFGLAVRNLKRRQGAIAWHWWR